MIDQCCVLRTWRFTLSLRESPPAPSGCPQELPLRASERQQCRQPLFTRLLPPAARELPRCSCDPSWRPCGSACLRPPSLTAVGTCWRLVKSDAAFSSTAVLRRYLGVRRPCSIVPLPRSAKCLFSRVKDRLRLLLRIQQDCRVLVMQPSCV